MPRCRKCCPLLPAVPPGAWSYGDDASSPRRLRLGGVIVHMVWQAKVVALNEAGLRKCLALIAPGRADRRNARSGRNVPRQTHLTTAQRVQPMHQSAASDLQRQRPSMLGRFHWPDVVLALAAAVGLFASISDYFDRLSGIQHEPGTLLVIAACGLILLGLAVVLTTTSRAVMLVFQWLILLGTTLTAIAGWFLMSWILTGAMVVATIAQVIRMAAPESTGIRASALAGR